VSRAAPRWRLESGAGPASAALLLGLSLGATAWAAPWVPEVGARIEARLPAAGPVLVCEPAEAVPGSWVVARSRGGWRPPITVRGMNREYRTFPDEDGWRALVPVPLETEAGDWKLIARGARGSADAVLTIHRRRAQPTRAVRRLAVTPERVRELRAARGRLGPALRRVHPDALWAGPFRRPVEGRVTSGFGIVRAYEGGASWAHRGLDFGAPLGDPVVAAAPGIVRLAGWLPAYGNTVVLDHGQTVATAYLHLAAVAVPAGRRVEAGQVLGTVGATGMATGPHLHFGVFIAGVAVDPAEILERGLP
jgi:murein DD-endopeptidase MepM/ murein hydrolase activator NlpD